jgi:hypothetical protein
LFERIDAGSDLFEFGPELLEFGLAGGDLLHLRQQRSS